MINIQSDIRAIGARLSSARSLRLQDVYEESAKAIGDQLSTYTKVDEGIIVQTAKFTTLRDLSFYDKRSGLICFEIALHGNYARTIEDMHIRGEPGTILISNSAVAEYTLQKGSSARGIVIYCNRRNFTNKYRIDIDRVQERSRPIFLNDHGSLLTLRIPLFSSTMVDVDQILNCNFDEPLRSQYISAKVTQILCAIVGQINEFGAGPRLFSPRGFRTQTFEAAAEIYRRELHNPPTIDRLAERLGIDQRELTKGFQEIFGQTPLRYQLQQRMEHAQLLLQEGGRSLSEVGRLVGYQGYRTFVRAYQSYHGRAPAPTTSPSPQARGG